MDQIVKVFAAKPGDLGSIPRTYLLEGVNVHFCSLFSVHIIGLIIMHARAHTHRAHTGWVCLTPNAWVIFRLQTMSIYIMRHFERGTQVQTCNLLKYSTCLLHRALRSFYTRLLVILSMKQFCGIEFSTCGIMSGLKKFWIMKLGFSSN